MASTITADNGVSSGSAGIKTSADSTGVLALQTTKAGGAVTTAITIDANQQVGIGTTSPSAPLAIGRVNSAEEGGQIDLCRASDNASSWGIDVFGSTSTPSLRFIDNVAAATRVVIDGSGNVGIGTSTAASRLTVGGASVNDSGAATYVGTIQIKEQGLSTVQATGGLEFKGSFSGSGYGSKITGTDDGQMLFGTRANSASFTERARIDSSGNLLVGTTSTSFSSSAGYKINASTAGQQQMCITVDTATGGHGTYHLYNLNATNNGFRFYVTANGGIYNFSGNNSNLSDERTKKNIEVSGDYLDKICAIPVKLFNYKDEAEGEQQTLGVIAQDVEAVAPELVNLAGFGDTPEDGVPLKSIYTTDMMFALMKCIQEQQALITQLQADVAALKGQQA